MASIKDLLAKKKNGASPATASKKVSKPADDEEEDSQVEGGEGEGEEEEAPAKPVKKVLAKKPAPKAAEPEEEEEEGEEEEAEEEEEAPAPKKAAKPAAKAPAKKAPAKAAEPEEEEEEESSEEEAEEEEAEEEAPAPKKAAAKAPVKAAAKAPAKAAAPAKKAAKPAADDEGEDEVPTGKQTRTGKNSAWGAKKEKERKELKPGSWMPQDELFSRFHDKLAEMGIAPPTKSVTIQVVKAFETFLEETLAEYDVKFVAKFKRREMEARVYAPNTELAQVATPYHTLVSPHTKVSLNLYYGKTMTKGTTTDDGEFVEGQFDAKGNFVNGKWGTDDEGNETFTPAKKKK